MGRGRAADWRRRSDAYHYQSAVGPQMGFASGEPAAVSAPDARIPPGAGAGRPDGPDDVGNPPDSRAIGRASDRTQFDARSNRARRLGVDLCLPGRASLSSKPVNHLSKYHAQLTGCAGMQMLGAMRTLGGMILCSRIFKLRSWEYSRVSRSYSRFRA